jgi:cytochrome P450 family 109
MQQPQHSPYRPATSHFLPRSPEDVPQIYNWFEQMRAHQPVFFTEMLPFWQVFRYGDVQTVLNDYSRFSSEGSFGDDPILSETLVTIDPPDHRKLRNLVNLAFTPRAVAHFSGRVAEITQDLLDKVKAAGTMDIVSDLAFPLPAKIIAELLGVPPEDWDVFRRWASAGGVGEGVQNGRTPRTMREEMTDYFSDLLAQRRKHPKDDLITSLSNAEIDGERLSEVELYSFCFLLLAAGQETTKNLIANSILCLTENPDSLARLRQQPELIPSAIEEVLRYLPPAWFVFRRTKEEVELGGQRIPANQMVQAWIASANRDSAQFPEADRFLVDRDPNRHVSFGHGIHFCIGAPLARLETRVALPMIIEQLKDLQRVPDVPVRVHAGLVFMVQNLPVTFTPA